MKKIDHLRHEMKKNNIDCYIVPTSDHHCSEYICAAFEALKYLSGFTGSAGTLVVTANEAGLFTDGRYFVQAERELRGTLITLYRKGEKDIPTINEYLKKIMKKGQTLAFDGRMVPASSGLRMADELNEIGVKINYESDLIALIWPERPLLPANKIWELSIDWTGQSTTEKISEVRKKLNESGNFALILNSLDDIMWLFNLRGSDIPQNPIALSYAYVTEDEAVLFIQTQIIDDDFRKVMTAKNIKIAEYHDFYEWLENLKLKKDHKILLDNEKCNYFIYELIKEKAKPVLALSPTTTLKAIKNETELKHIREVYLKDSIAVIKFIKWLKENNEAVSEIDAAKKMDALRSEIPGFLDISFNTISAYGANAAIVHYQADEENNAIIGKDGLYLIDSGGQYFGGTTDITRTIATGEISAEMKRHFTAVARGMLNLSNLTFLSGVTGRSIDIIARKPLWDIKYDYKHGTGHGIGYMLSVHEGPQRISMPYNEDVGEIVLEPGMLISNEPGVYKAYEYGIRLENVMAVKEIEQNECGKFLGFYTLTLVPIDLGAIDETQLTKEDKKQLNDYHQRVYEVVSAYLNDEEKKWLKKATRAI
ncbi:MAG: aminopeptidase P family protein [Lachnospiraceae bacterium]|nr:aminopeptidase P family protein [Lachnospiraceae bacterium]